MVQDCTVEKESNGPPTSDKKRGGFSLREREKEKKRIKTLSEDKQGNNKKRFGTSGQRDSWVWPQESGT